MITRNDKIPYKRPLAAFFSQIRNELDEWKSIRKTLERDFRTEIREFPTEIRETKTSMEVMNKEFEDTKKNFTSGIARDKALICENEELR